MSLLQLGVSFQEVTLMQQRKRIVGVSTIRRGRKGRYMMKSISTALGNLLPVQSILPSSNLGILNTCLVVFSYCPTKKNLVFLTSED